MRDSRFEVGKGRPQSAESQEILAKALLGDERKAELGATRRRIQEAGEVREIVYLSRREQKSLYEPNLAVPSR